MNPNRPARLNRTVLAVLGLVCLAAGGVVLLIGTGLLGNLLPVPADAPLLPPGLVIPGWGPSAVAAVAVVIGLLALRWLIAQTIRRPAGSNWQLSPDTTTGTTHIDSHAAVRPLADEIEDYPGVRSATASLTGPRQQPHLYLRVSADDHADISELRRRIGSNAIPRLMQALNLPASPPTCCCALSVPAAPGPADRRQSSGGRTWFRTVRSLRSSSCRRPLIRASICGRTVVRR